MHMKSELKDQLIGIDADNEISLFEYGLLIAPYTKDGHTDEYFAVYSIGNDLFDTGHLRECELNKLINGEEWASAEDINGFLSHVGMSKNEWLQLSMVHKLHDCIGYWGHENIMGSGCIDSEFTKEKAEQLYF